MRTVLQVNSAGQPLGFIRWNKALRQIGTGKAQIIAGHPDRILRSEKLEFLDPLIIQLDHYVKLRPMPKNFDSLQSKSKSAFKSILFARDGWKCQYCSCRVTLSSGSIDHIKPKDAFRKEGRPEAEANTWENVVASCKPCNNSKANIFPYRQPTNTPKKPSYVQTMWGGYKYHPIQAEYVANYFQVEAQFFLPVA